MSVLEPSVLALPTETTLQSVGNEVHEIHAEMAALEQLVIQNRHQTTQDLRRQMILGLCTVTEVNRLTSAERMTLADQLRAAFMNETTDTTMHHDGGESGNASNFEHLTCAFETAVVRAFEFARIPEVKPRMKIERRGLLIERDSDVGALVWLDDMLVEQGTSMDTFSRREVILYRNNIRWRMFNQEYSTAWMREHLWQAASKTLLYLESIAGAP